MDFSNTFSTRSSRLEVLLPSDDGMDGDSSTRRSVDNSTTASFGFVDASDMNIVPVVIGCSRLSAAAWIICKEAFRKIGLVRGRADPPKGACRN